MSTQESYELTLQSERNSIKMVEPFLRSVKGIDVLGERRFHDLLVSMTEAVNNAIIHGNECDPTKQVTVTVRATSKEVVAVIHDCGPGFDPDTVPDPTLPENLLSEGGRGVFLIQHLADTAEFTITSSGMVVAITYYL